ncbi:MAG: response regulator [Deltaproteobacteria bacterium]|nr:response regulator [Deltaproteobacteria bacterium]
MEAQLRLADRMVSVGTLAAGVAHEINNPLSFVMSNLDLVAEELRAQSDVVTAPPMGALLELISEAQEGAERVRKIVRGLKTFSRADEERRRPLDVAAVIELSLNMAWNEIRHRARVVKDFGTAPFVEADETRLAEVFINLLVNAAQALPEGNADTNQIRILVSTDSMGRAIVEVHDTGAGIPRASLQHIFDPFFTTKPIGEGTGLGLSICQGIVTGLGGDITVESALGVGTTFRVALPPARAPEATTVDRAPAALVRAEGRRGRVLVVDDDVKVGKALSRILARDHDVEFVSEGRLALERIRAGERFDVFFCDLMMPDLTGMDIHRELAKIAPDQLDRMVLITGGAFTPGARQFLDTVTNERMDKPFDTQNVRALVRRLVR